MPSIAEAIARNQQRISQGGITGADNSPAAPSPSVAAPPEQIPNLPSRGVWPANMILGSDVADQSQVFQKNAVRSRSFPFPPASGPISKTTTVVQTSGGGGTSIELETNNIPNPSQDTLNLIAGSNITLNATPGGGVEIAATSGTDGLIHGETPWESDPSFVSVQDDFTGVINNTATNGVIQSEQPWAAVLATSGSFGWTSAFPCLGSLKLINNGTSSEASFIQLGNAFAGSSSPSVAYPVCDYSNWKMVWVFDLSKADNTNTTDAGWSWTQVSFYLGFSNYGLLNANPGISSIPRPQYFVGLRYDTDATAPAINDTQFVFEAVTNFNVTSATRANLNTQGNTSATGISAVEGHQYRFEMLSTTAGSVQMTLTDGTAGITYSATLTVPQFTQVSSDNSIFGQTASSTLTKVSLKNASAVNQICPFGPGSKFTLAGITLSGFTGNNGTWVCVGGGGGSANNQFYFRGGQFTAASTVTVNGTCAGYPAFLPYCAFGNDSNVTTPTANSKGVALDFFSFIWNPGVGGGTGTPNPLKARYF